MVTLNVGDLLLSASYSDAYTSSTGSTSNYNENTYDPTTTGGCATYSYNWSSGLGSSSYFALLTGETNGGGIIPNFGQVNVQGIIYDNHFNGGPPGHCITTPYNLNYAEAFHDSYASHIATESLVNSNCAFYDDYW